MPAATETRSPGRAAWIAAWMVGSSDGTRITFGASPGPYEHATRANVRAQTAESAAGVLPTALNRRRMLRLCGKGSPSPVRHHVPDDQREDGRDPQGDGEGCRPGVRGRRRLDHPARRDGG